MRRHAKWVRLCFLTCALTILPIFQVFSHAICQNISADPLRIMNGSTKIELMIAGDLRVVKIAFIKPR